MTPKPKGSRTRMALDIDGVVCNWEAQARKLLLETFGIDLPLSEHWNSIKDDVPKKAWNWLWDVHGGLHPLFYEAEPYQEVFAVIDELAQLVDIVIITSVPELAIYDRTRWLWEYAIPCHELHVTMHPKSSIRPHCDMYLEDSPANIQELVTSTDAIILVMDRPWNREVQATDRIIRCQGWNDVLAMVR